MVIFGRKITVNHTTTMPDKSILELKLLMMQAKYEFYAMGYKLGIPKLLIQVFPERFQNADDLRIATQVYYMRCVDVKFIDAYLDLLEYLRNS